jgi:uncharacterized protein DUF4240
MTDQEFWDLIARFDWSAAGNDDAVIAPTVTALARLTPDAILAFQDHVAARLYALDTKAHASHIGTYAFRADNDDAFSEDTFVYARCVVVANGRAAFDHICANPNAMPTDMEFESLLRIAPEAYSVATGRRFDHEPSLSFETYSNQAGWA